MAIVMMKKTNKKKQRILCRGLQRFLPPSKKQERMHTDSSKEFC